MCSSKRPVDMGEKFLGTPKPGSFKMRAWMSRVLEKVIANAGIGMKPMNSN